MTVLAREAAAYHEDGFVIVRAPAVTKMKEDLTAAMGAAARKLIARDPVLGTRAGPAPTAPFHEVMDWCVANEQDHAVSRACYELFPALIDMVALVGHPLLVGLCRRLGISDPLPSTLPAVRIDRPHQERFLSPAHQDFWSSMLSLNGAVIWCPLVPMEADMGRLEVVRGSHRAGVLPYRHHSDEWPYTTRTAFDDSAFEAVDVPDDGLLYFSQLLLHRSGFNVSRRTRVTLQVRYNDFDTLAAPTSSFVPKYSTFVIQEQQRRLAGGEGAR